MKATWKSRIYFKNRKFHKLRTTEKILNLKEFDVNYETLGKLKQELDFANLEWSLRKIEADIQKQAIFTCSQNKSAQ